MRPVHVAILLLAAPAGAEVIRVTPADQPRPSVQAALDRARAGDIVRLAPGVYRERVELKNSGEHGRPIVLEGEPGAVLDGSNPIQPAWQPAADVAPGVWRATVPFSVFTLVAEGKIVTMLREDRVDPAKVQDPAWHWPTIFRNGVGPSKWDGVKALALYRPGPKELLVRFRGDLDPRALAITLAPREPIVRINYADRCVVRGLTLRNAAYGVLIEHSLGSVVEGCTIGPVDYGVWLGAESDRCTVRFSELFMNPYAGADPHQRPGSWDNWQAHKTGGHYDRFGVQIQATRGGHEVHDNDIHDTWDGIEDRGAPGQNVGLRIHHNRIYNVSDDGLEPNGAEEECHWNDNLVQRSICGFRIKAPTRGPLYAYRNIFLDNGEDFRNYGEVELKPAYVYVYHNTCTAKVAVQSNKVFGIGNPNYHYFNNLFHCAYWWAQTSSGDRRSVDPNWKGDHNVYVRRGTDARWDETKALAQRLGLDTHSLWVEGDAGFRDLAGLDVSLQPGSPAIGRGAELRVLLGRDLPGLPAVARPDAGALQAGEPLPVLPRKPGLVQAPAAGMWPGPEAKRADLWTGPNLLTNGGFEQALEGWSRGHPAAYAVQREGAAEGQRYLRIAAPGAVPDLERPLTGLTPGEVYVLLYQSRNNTFEDLRIIVRDTGTSQYLANGKAEAGPVWRRGMLRFVAPRAAARLEISPRTDGTADLDGLAIHEGT